MADVGLHVVRKFSREGKLLLTLGTEGEAGEDASHFFKPTDIAFAPNHDVFISDGYGNSRVVHFNWVHCIALDSKGNVYLGDIMGKRVQKFVPRR